MLADDIAQVGTLLGQIAFAGAEALDYYHDARSAAHRRNKTLEIRLHLATPELERLPWELMMLRHGHPDDRDYRYAALDPRTTMVRCHSEGVEPRTPQPFEVFEADAYERQQSRRASGNGDGDGDVGRYRWSPQFKIDEIDPDSIRPPTACTFERITHRLDGRADGCAIFYLLTHGERLQTGKPVVELSGETLDAPRLGYLLAGHGTQLAIIAACSAGVGDRWLGFGATLSRYVPAVISMQSRVDVSAAERFVTHVLQELRQGSPVDRAVAHARRQIEASGPFADWWVPILHGNRSADVGFTVTDPLPVAVRGAVFVQTRGSDEPRSFVLEDGTPVVRPAGNLVTPGLAEQLT